MSYDVDRRVVEMQFDNAQFERGVRDTTRSLESLKKGLDLSNATKNLSELQARGDKFSLANIADSVQSLADRFSTMGIIGMSVLHNLTTKAMDLATNMAKAVTITPIKDGFGEYELKMGSIQTIMMSTGESLETVNKYLGDLNTYSDRTIYSFSDMTSNIGKFTNAGVSLHDSVKAIQGVSNVAAISGANTNEASRAMYNFAQALSAGYVKLIDWKSIENANMATVEFKTELLESAVAAKTLTKTADGMYKTLGGKAISATQGFNDSLQDEWMTTEALVATLNRYSDETTEIGKKAFAAAQDVKTYTQLIDTLGEALGSGWATSFELIVGDFEEAKVLWTGVNNVLSSFIDASSDARNEVLSAWKANGGRDAIIESISNAFNGLLQVLKPIGEAWKEVFPAITGERLAEFSKRIKDVTEQFKIGDETAAKLKVVFQGLFSVVNIGLNILSSLLSAVGGIASTLAPAGEGVLDFAASIGKMLTEFNVAIERTGIFKAIFGSLAATVSIALKGVATAINWVGKSLANLSGGVNFSWLELLAKVVDVVGAAFRKMGELIHSTLKGLDFNSGLAFINGGILAGVLLGVKKFISNMTEMVSKGDGFLNFLQDLKDGILDCFEAFQNNLKADILKKIAVAIALIAASLYILSTIEPEKMGVALGAITILFAELFGSISMLTKTMSGTDFTGLGKIVVSIIGLASAVLILSFAMKNLASLDWNGILKGLTGITVLLAELVAVSLVLSANNVKMAKGSVGLLLLSASLVVLSQAVRSLATLSWEELARGLVGMATALGIIVGALYLIPKGIALQSAGLIGVTTALVILAHALNNMGGMTWEEIAKGLVTLAASLGVIAGVMTLMVGAIPGALAILVMAGALLVLAPVLLLLGSLSWESIIKSFIAIAGAFAIFGAAAWLLEPIIPSMTELAEALALLGAALLAIGVGLAAFSSGLAALAVAFATSGGAIYSMVESLLGLLPLFFEKLGEGVVAFARAIAKRWNTRYFVSKKN